MRSHICNYLRPRPRSFASLMEVYETNYIYFRRLCPDLAALGNGAISSPQGAVDLHISVVERCRYTTTVLLTHYIADNEGIDQPAPNLKVRIYDDARVAQVLGDCEAHESSLAERWEQNRFLSRWLGYCLSEGHSLKVLSESEANGGESSFDSDPVIAEPGIVA